MKSNLLLLTTVIVLIPLKLTSQGCVSLDTAIQTPVTLICSGGTLNRSGVAWNPVDSLYYSCNAGSGSYPFEVFSANGGTPDSTTTGGTSWRGLWWNTALGQLEGNTNGASGWFSKDLSITGYPLASNTIIFAGSNQPNIQSCGDLDYDANEVIFYDNGNIYRYDRNTSSASGSYALNGIPGGIISDYSVVYTGCSGKEIGIYDYANQRVYLFDKLTGNYNATIQLPATAPAITTFRVSYANDLFWLFDENTNTWYSYQLFNPCLFIDASINLVNGNLFCNGDSLDLFAPTNSSYSYQWQMNGTDIPGATDSVLTIDTIGNYTLVITTTGGCMGISDTVSIGNFISVSPVITQNGDTLFVSSAYTTYQWMENNVPVSGATTNALILTSGGEYAVEVTDTNGCTLTSNTIVSTLGTETITNIQWNVYPVPARDMIYITCNAAMGSTVRIELFTIDGKQVGVNSIFNGTGTATTYNMQLPATITTGVYLLKIQNGEQTGIKKLVIE